MPGTTLFQFSMAKTFQAVLKPRAVGRVPENG
jgi:hypothetical protein